MHNANRPESNANRFPRRHHLTVSLDGWIVVYSACPWANQSPNCGRVPHSLWSRVTLVSLHSIIESDDPLPLSNGNARYEGRRIGIAAQKDNILLPEILCQPQSVTSRSGNRIPMVSSPHSITLLERSQPIHAPEVSLAQVRVGMETKEKTGKEKR